MPRCHRGTGVRTKTIPRTKRYRWHRDYDHYPFIAAVSRALDNANVPSVLWGQILLDTWGVPTVVNELDFIVPDQCVDLAKSTLLNTGLGTECTFGPSCKMVTKPLDIIPPGHVHTNNVSWVRLFKHSDTLVQLESLEATEARDIIYTTDLDIPLKPGPGQGTGRWDAGLYPVRVPAIHRFLEAAILGRIRDHLTLVEGEWDTMITYLATYPRLDGAIDLDKLRPSHRTFFESIYKPRTVRTRDHMAELEALLAAHEHGEEASEPVEVESKQKVI